MSFINWSKVYEIKSLISSLEKFLDTVFEGELEKILEQQRLLKSKPETFEYLRFSVHRAAIWYEILQRLKERGYSFDMRFSNEIEEFQNMILFAYSFDLLVQRQIISLDDKQVKGNLLDPERFESLTYEVLVAANYVSNDFSVELPDLLKTGRADIHANKNGLDVYVECKRLRRSEKYVNVAIEVMRSLHKREFSGIIDVLFSKSPMTGKQVKEVVDLVEEAIVDDKDFSSRGYTTIRIQKLPELIENIYQLSLPRPETIEYLLSSSYVGIFNGIFKVKEPKILILRDLGKPERLKGRLLDRLSEAYEQLKDTETKFSARKVICIDISEVAGRPIIQLPELIKLTVGPEILASRLEQACKEWLLKHLDVDAVVLTQNKLYSNEVGVPYALVIDSKPTSAYVTSEWTIETTIIPIPQNVSPENLVNLGVEMVKRGNYWLAETYYKMALNIKSDIKEAWNNLGRLYTEFLERPDTGLRYLERALELDSTYVSALINKGIALTKLGRYNDALMELDKAVELDSTNYRAYYHRALIHYMLGHYTKAYEDCSKALNLRPDYIFANKLMEELQKRKGYSQN